MFKYKYNNHFGQLLFIYTFVILLKIKLFSVSLQYAILLIIIVIAQITVGGLAAAYKDRVSYSFLHQFKKNVPLFLTAQLLLGSS